MPIDDRVGKLELFEDIVGKPPFQGSYAGDVPDFRIPLADVDETFLSIKKMQRCYQDDRPISEYFAPNFAAIEKAYLAQDRGAFKEAVMGLMVSIDSD